MKNKIHDQALPVPIPMPEAEIAPWLASTYAYLSPLLRNRSIPLSSFGLFENELIEIIRGLPSGSRVLEIGGHSISGCSEMSKFNLFILSPEEVPSIGRTNYLRGISEKIPFEDNYFNCIICQFVLEHTLNPLKAISEMVRVLSSDGQLILAIPVDRELYGKPPLFHRWRFVFSVGPVPARTIVLETLNMNALELQARNSSTWMPNIQIDDACLFLFDKQEQVSYATQTINL